MYATVTKENGITVVEVTAPGRILDHEMCPALEEQIQAAADEADPPIVLVDLSNSDYFSNAFNRVLANVWRSLKRRDGRLALSSLNEPCREMIHNLHLDTIWAVFETRRRGDCSIVGTDRVTQFFSQRRRWAQSTDYGTTRPMSTRTGQDPSPVAFASVPRAR